MKKTLTLATLLFAFIFAFGQKVIELNSKYFLDSNKFDNGKSDIIEIIEYVNYDMYLKHKEARKNNKRLSIADENKAFETKLFHPEKGNYFLNNEEHNQKLRFSIDEKGQFTGTSQGEIQDYDSKINYYTFHFKNGKTVATEVKDSAGKLIKNYEINDSILITKGYNQNEKLNYKTIFKKNKSYPNSIVIDYYENGNIKSENDYISDTNKTFNENGLPQSYKNYKTKEEIKYDDFGKKLTRSYHTEKERCFEYFKSGIITQRSCANKDNTKDVEQSFKDGKLDYYHITEKGERKKYDKNNRLIKTEEAVSLITVP